MAANVRKLQHTVDAHRVYYRPVVLTTTSTLALVALLLALSPLYHVRTLTSRTF